MNEATCAVLAAIFPLYMVTVVLERRATNMGIRRQKFYRFVSLYSTACALIGTVYAVIGVAVGGFSMGQSLVLWALFAAASVGVALAVIGSLASAELEEDWWRTSEPSIRPSTAGRRRPSRMLRLPLQRNAKGRGATKR